MNWMHFFYNVQGLGIQFGVIELYDSGELCDNISTMYISMFNTTNVIEINAGNLGTSAGRMSIFY